MELPDGVGYTITGKTVKMLPPGMYDVVSIPQGLVWGIVDTRTDDLLRFPETPSDRVVAEIEDFWNRAELYERYGLPYKRGVLLYGPPGSGKTCTLRQVSEDVVKRGGYVLIYRKPDLLLMAYRQLREVHPKAPLVILMEDFEGLLAEHQSTILNILDGVEEFSGVVFLATTNYPEKLGAHIVNRPSRFDRRILIDHPRLESRRLYLESLTLPGDRADLDQLARDTEGMSLAHVKELFVGTQLLGMEYTETLRGLKDLAKKPTSLDTEFTELFGGQYM